jgi:dimethylaniline monooxygenase (N-oxide forming)
MQSRTDTCVLVPHAFFQVIFCTGYNIALPMIENGTLIATEHNEFQAYKYMFPFATADHNTLGIIGMIQVNRALLKLEKFCS